MLEFPYEKHASWSCGHDSVPEYLVLTGLPRAIGEDRPIPDSSKVATHTACTCHISPLYGFVFPYPRLKVCGMASSSVHPSSCLLQFGMWSKPEAFGTLLYKVLPHPLPALLERGRWEEWYRKSQEWDMEESSLKWKPNQEPFHMRAYPDMTLAPANWYHAVWSELQQLYICISGVNCCQ